MLLFCFYIFRFFHQLCKSIPFFINGLKSNTAGLNIDFAYWFPAPVCSPFRKIRIACRLRIKKLLFFLRSPKGRNKKIQAIFRRRKLLNNIFYGRIIVADNLHGLFTNQQICNNIQNGLRLTCTRGTFDHAHMIQNRLFNSMVLTLIATKRKNQQTRVKPGLCIILIGIQINRKRVFFTDKVYFFILVHQNCGVILCFKVGILCNLPQIGKYLLSSVIFQARFFNTKLTD